MMLDHMSYARDGSYERHCVIHWSPCVCDGNVYPYFRVSRAREYDAAFGKGCMWSEVSCCAHKLWAVIGQSVQHDSDLLVLDAVLSYGHSLRLRHKCSGSLVRAKKCAIVAEAFDIIWWHTLENRRRRLEVEKILLPALSDAASIVADFV